MDVPHFMRHQVTPKPWILKPPKLGVHVDADWIFPWYYGGSNASAALQVRNKNDHAIAIMTFIINASLGFPIHASTFLCFSHSSLQSSQIQKTWPLKVSAFQDVSLEYPHIPHGWKVNSPLTQNSDFISSNLCVLDTNSSLVFCSAVSCLEELRASSVGKHENTKSEWLSRSYCSPVSGST